MARHNTMKAISFCISGMLFCAIFSKETLAIAHTAGMSICRKTLAPEHSISSEALKSASRTQDYAKARQLADASNSAITEAYRTGTLSAEGKATMQAWYRSPLYGRFSKNFPRPDAQEGTNQINRLRVLIPELEKLVAQFYVEFEQAKAHHLAHTSEYQAEVQQAEAEIARIKKEIGAQIGQLGAAERKKLNEELGKEITDMENVRDIEIRKAQNKAERETIRERWALEISPRNLQKGARLAAIKKETETPRLELQQKLASLTETHLKKIDEIQNWKKTLFAKFEREMIAKGFLRHGAQDVFKDALSAAGEKQPVKFTELKLLIPGSNLPAEMETGFYFPKSPELEFDPLLHKVMRMVLPGTGTTRSQAKSVMDISMIMSGTSRVAALGDIDKKAGEKGPEFKPGFRAFSVPFDSPGNGLGEFLPDEFLTSEGILLLNRYAMLVLKCLHPELPFYLEGRSQGGLIAKSMGQLYGPANGLNGVIAVGPSSTDIDIIRGSIEPIVNDEMRKAQGDQNTEVHWRAWEAYLEHTWTFQDAPQSLAPTLIIYGQGDDSYPPEAYAAYIAAYVAHDPDHRKLLTVTPYGLNVSAAQYGKVSHDQWRSSFDQAPLAGKANSRLPFVLTQMFHFYAETSGDRSVYETYKNSNLGSLLEN